MPFDGSPASRVLKASPYPLVIKDLRMGEEIERNAGYEQWPGAVLPQAGTPWSVAGSATDQAAP